MAPTEVLALSHRLILEQVAPGDARADAYAGLALLSRLVYPKALIDQVLTRRLLMIESPMYQEILAEGEQKGREEGHEEGLCQSVLEVLETRFGSVPAAVETQVRQQKSLDALAALHRRAVVVESLAAFAQELAAAPSFIELATHGRSPPLAAVVCGRPGRLNVGDLSEVVT